MPRLSGGCVRTAPSGSSVSGGIKKQLADLGLSEHDLKVGQVYVLPDGDIKFPTNALSRAKGVGVHEDRTVVVVQHGAELQNPLVRTVLVAPTSSRIDLKTANDIFLNAGEGGLDKDSICMVGHVQPVLKSNLKHPCGRLENRRVEEIQVLLATITGA